MSTDTAPFFAPRSTPARVVKRSCNVNGQTGTGMRMNAPTAVRAVNREMSIRSFVFMLHLFIFDVMPIIALFVSFVNLFIDYG